MEQEKLYVRLKGRSRSGMGDNRMFEHLCELMPQARSDSSPRVLWCAPIISYKPVWCIEAGSRGTRFEIFACPWCLVKLPRPDRDECTCGADLVREDLGHSQFFEHRFTLRNGVQHTLNVKVYIVEFFHERDCPALRVKEVDR